MRITRPVFPLVLLTAVLFAMNLAMKSAHGADVWRTDFADAWKAAQASGRPLVVHFFAHWCGPCRQMEQSVLSTPEVLAQLEANFIAVKIDADEYPDIVNRFRIRSLPSDVLIDPQGEILSQTTGYQEKNSYVARLDRIESRYLQSQRFRVANQTRGNATQSGPDRANTRQLRRGSQVAENNARAQSPRKYKNNAATRPVLIGLDGYSPVSLKKDHAWRKGDPRFAYNFQGVTFYLTSRDEWEEFQRNSDRYAPRMLGCDAVILFDSDRAIPGDTRYGAFFDGDLYLFANAQTRTTFKRNPVRYSQTRHVLRTDELLNSRLR